MTREEAIDRIEDHMKVHKVGQYPHLRLKTALDMAIAALRAQQEPLKLDRSRWEKCEGCELCKNDYAVYHIFPHYKFCPICGRPPHRGGLVGAGEEDRAVRLIDAEPIEKFIENGLNCKDPKKRFGHDAIEILTEVHYAPTIGIDLAAAPNPPLTLEELREMDGEPVYDWMGYEWFVVAEVTDEDVIMTDGTVFDVDEESVTTAVGRFYRRKPEEVE